MVGYARPVADLPIDLEEGLSETLTAALDPYDKIPRGLDALGPIAGRDVLLIGGGPRRAAQLGRLGAASVAEADAVAPGLAFTDAAFDSAVSFWSAFRGVDPAEVAETERVLRPGGRLLIVHDYGRDDVSRLRGERPEYGSWGRRDGPFLRGGFRIRVLHAFWVFESVAAAAAFLEAAFGDAGREVAAGLKRPRLTYNVAVYHRTRPDGDSVAAAR